MGYDLSAPLFDTIGRISTTSLFLSEPQRSSPALQSRRRLFLVQGRGLLDSLQKAWRSQFKFSKPKKQATLRKAVCTPASCVINIMRLFVSRRRLFLSVRRAMKFKEEWAIMEYDLAHLFSIPFLGNRPLLYFQANHGSRRMLLLLVRCAMTFFEEGVIAG
jgi:hypothetical protein